MKKAESEQRLLNITKRFARYGIGKELPPKEEVEEMKKEGVLFLISDVFWGRTGPCLSFATTSAVEAIRAHQDLFFWMTTFICNVVGLSSYKKICEAISLELGKPVLPPDSKCFNWPYLILLRRTILHRKVFTKQDKTEVLYAAAMVYLEEEFMWSDLNRLYCKYNPNRFEVEKLSESRINMELRNCYDEIYRIFDWGGYIPEDKINLNALTLLRRLISISITQKTVEEWVEAKKKWEDRVYSSLKSKPLQKG